MKSVIIIVIFTMEWVLLAGQPRHITVAADGSGEFTSVQAYGSRQCYPCLPGTAMAPLCSNGLAQVRDGWPYKAGGMA
jgi:hypothetical protein